jgi:N-glycosylase/DNA lyase
MAVDAAARQLTATVAINGRSARTVVISAGRPGHASVRVLGTPPGKSTQRRLEGTVRHILGLDADLSPFYALAAADPDLAWATAGAGRMLRSATVFEEVVKTICTTNCAWSATERMVGALVEHLGRRAPGAPATGVGGRAFPTPEAMAEVGEDFYRDVVRAGYRAPYFVNLAHTVAAGEVDIESLGTATRGEMDDDAVGAALQALPGVGPYAAAHVMMMIGRYSRLILDSWTRPKYARLIGKKRVADRTIERRFRPYGVYAGLAFWLFLTRDWVDDGQPSVRE